LFISLRFSSAAKRRLCSRKSIAFKFSLKPQRGN
jgi:hypothetical protein